MNFRVTYFVFDSRFIFETDSVAELYRAVCSIIKREGGISFPDQDNTCSEYLKICSDIGFGEKLSYENHVLKIEKISAE